MQASSIPATAAKLDIAVSTLWAMIAAGRGPKITKIGGRTVCFDFELERWIADQPSK